MCHIAISADGKLLVDLIKKGINRGTSAWSTFVSEHKSSDERVYRYDRPIEEYDFKLLESNQRDVTQIVHLQSPTNSAGHRNLHPAECGSCGFLWHNGIILGTPDNQWDTQNIAESQCKSRSLGEFMMRLSNLNGSFACVFADTLGNINLFRNSAAPLYWSTKGVCSVKFDGSEEVPPNFYFALHKNQKDEYTLSEVARFYSAEEPFYFDD